MARRTLDIQTIVIIHGFQEPEKKIICEFEGPDMSSVKNAVDKIGLPVSAIMEVKVVKLEPYPEEASKMSPYHSHLT